MLVDDSTIVIGLIIHTIKTGNIRLDQTPIPPSDLLNLAVRTSNLSVELGTQRLLRELPQSLQVQPLLRALPCHGVQHLP